MFKISLQCVLLIYLIVLQTPWGNKEFHNVNEILIHGSENPVSFFPSWFYVCDIKISQVKSLQETKYDCRFFLNRTMTSAEKGRTVGGEKLRSEAH